MFIAEDFIIAIFYCVDDLLDQLSIGQKIRKSRFTIC